MAQTNKNFTVEKIATWLKESVAELVNGSFATYWFKLKTDKFGRTWAIVLGFSDAAIDDDPKYYSDTKSPNFRICTKVAYNDSALQCDYDWDWVQPWDPQTGDVDDDDSPLVRQTTDKDWQQLAHALKHDAYRKVKAWENVYCRR